MAMSRTLRYGPVGDDIKKLQTRRTLIHREDVAERFRAARRVNVELVSAATGVDQREALGRND